MSSPPPPSSQSSNLWLAWNIATQAYRVTTCQVCNPECRGKWFFAITGILYTHMCIPCPPLAWRFFLHILLLGMICLLVVSLVAFYMVRRRIKSQEYTQRQGTIVRVREIPRLMRNPMSILTVRLDPEEGEQDDRPGGDEPMEERGNTGDYEQGNMDQGRLVNVKAHSGFQVGSTITLDTVDGDLPKTLFMPYERQTYQRMTLLILMYFVLMSMVLGLLKWSFGDNVPIAFASSEQIEQACFESRYCQWIMEDSDDADEQVGAMSSNDDVTKATTEEEGVNEDDEHAYCCSIPWHVAWSYNILVFVLTVFPFGVAAYSWWKARRQHRAAMGNQGNYSLINKNESGELKSSSATNNADNSLELVESRSQPHDDEAPREPIGTIKSRENNVV